MLLSAFIISFFSFVWSESCVPEARLSRRRERYNQETAVGLYWQSLNDRSGVRPRVKERQRVRKQRLKNVKGGITDCLC